MTTLYNGSLTIQGLNPVVTGLAGITTDDTIVSILNNIENSLERRVMMEIGSYNTNCGNYGNTYKYALGFSNSTNGTGGSFIIEACKVSPNSDTAFNIPVIRLFTLDTVNLTTTVPLIVNGSGTINGNTIINGVTTINGLTTINGNNIINGNIGINGGLTLSSYGTFNGSCIFNNTCIFNNPISVSYQNTPVFSIDNTGAASFKENQWIKDMQGNIRILLGIGNGGPLDTRFNSVAGQGFIFSSGTIKKLTLDGGGNLTATGDITAFSDLRLKENIVTIDSPLEKINAIRGVYYTRKDNPGPRHVGVIAQEVEEVLPEVVLTDAATNKSVAYANMVALLIEGIKEQGKLITSLQSTVEKQQSSIQVLETAVTELRSKVSVIDYTLEEEQSTIQFLKPMVLELQSSVEEGQSNLESLQEIIGSLENLNTPVEVNEDAEVDTESSL